MLFSAIYRRTTNKRKEAAKYVRILASRSGYTKEGFGFFAMQTHSTHEWDGKRKRFVPATREKPKYVTVVTIIDDDLNCLVSCSCKDFLYRWEVALTTKGAAEVEYSNGAMPTITNPSLAPRCCKHLSCMYDKINHQLAKLKPRKPKQQKQKRVSKRRSK